MRHTLRMLPTHAAVSRGITALALVAGLMLAGCTGGGDALTQPMIQTPAADLDTTRAPPQTVTSTPLLPPMPQDPAAQPASPGALPPAAADASPLEYDHLYSDDEQVQIKSDLAAAAARVQKN